MQYWQDEASFSPTVDIGYSWFRPGQRPERNVKIIREYTYVLAAADPETGDLFGLLMPWLNAELFQVFLDEFAKHLETFYDLTKDEVWLLVDRAGWHVSKELVIPTGIKLIVMPSGAAEINPIEQLWLYIREHYTRNVVWNNSEHLEETLIQAFRDLWAEPTRLQSVCAAGVLSEDLLVNL